MIDYNDSDELSIVSLLVEGPVGFIIFIIAVIVLFFAMSNDSDCLKKTCPNDTRPKLSEHSCLCVTEAK